MNTPVIIIDCEGAIEHCTKIVYKAMKDKKKTPVSFRFLCTSDWMHVQFLNHMLTYLKQKKARKVEHVKLDIYIEEKED